MTIANLLTNFENRLAFGKVMSLVSWFFSRDSRMLRGVTQPSGCRVFVCVCLYWCRVHLGLCSSRVILGQLPCTLKNFCTGLDLVLAQPPPFLARDVICQCPSVCPSVCL